MAEGGADIAMQNFTANTLRNMGSGGGTGGGTGAGLLTDVDLLAQMPKRYSSPIFMWIPDKLFEGRQGQIESVELNKFFGQLSPPITPMGSGQKIPNLMGRK